MNPINQNPDSIEHFIDENVAAPTSDNENGQPVDGMQRALEVASVEFVDENGQTTEVEPEKRVVRRVGGRHLI